MVFARFSAAVRAMALELHADPSETHVFKDDNDSYSASFVAVGRILPYSACEDGSTSKVRYDVTLCMTYGKDSVDVMVDRQAEAFTGETRLTALETSGSDAVEPLIKKAGISVYV